MKVVESLFKNYLQTNAADQIQKFTSALAVLEITDGEGKHRQKLHSRAKTLSARFPISVYMADRFLREKSTLLRIRRGDVTVQINKALGDDYRVVEDLAEFINEVNVTVIRSMKSYNSDRARISAASDEDNIEDLI